MWVMGRCPLGCCPLLHAGCFPLEAHSVLGCLGLPVLGAQPLSLHPDVHTLQPALGTDMQAAAATLPSQQQCWEHLASATC